MLKFKHGLSIALFGIYLLPATTWAFDSNMYIGSQFSVIDPDSDRPGNPDTSMGISGYLGKPLSPHVNLEWQLFVNDIDTASGLRNDVVEYGSNLDLVYQWGDRNQFTPYVLGGVGVIRNKVANTGTRSVTTGYGNVGLGAVFTPQQDSNRYKFRIRGETRYAHNSLKDGQNDLQFRIGLELPLGRTVEKTIEVERIVEKEVPAPVPLQPQAPDEDGDGVNDLVDACPHTLPNTVVDGFGCAYGLREIKQITFMTDSDHLTPNAKLLLDQLARALNGQPNINVQIVGHTDSVGATNYNQSLSQKRALAVQNYLLGKGVNAMRFSLGAVGETRPTSNNNTASGRELNRRAEIRIQLVR